MNGSARNAGKLHLEKRKVKSMLIAIDGACKRNGEPDCFSTGVAWFITDTGDMFFKAACETQSTSQRGELSGLLEALKYATENAAEDEDVIIVTDSEYMFNSVDKEWCLKWRAGSVVKASQSRMLTCGKRLPVISIS